MRVLVTGATGFVGYVVADALRRTGHDVRALTRSDRPLPPGVERVRGDVGDPGSVRAAVEGCDGLCHLAALVRVRESRADPLAFWRCNVGGTLALLDAVAARPGPPVRLVVASTCAMYDDAVRRVAEDAVPRPSHPYGTTKLAADLAVADLAATGAIGAVSLRAFNVAGGVGAHGDRDETRLIPKLMAVARGRAPALQVNGDGSAVRDYLHVADMADAFVAALPACRPGEWTAYHVGAGRGSSIAEVIAAAEAVAGRRLPVRHGPPVPEPAELVADTARIERELGWRAHRSDLSRIIVDAYAAASSQDS